jgi:hypothetical protein
MSWPWYILFLGTMLLLFETSQKICWKLSCILCAISGPTRLRLMSAHPDSSSVVCPSICYLLSKHFVKAKGIVHIRSADWHEILCGLKTFCVVLMLDSWSSCHEGVWESGCLAPPFLASAVDGGEWSASRPSHFTPGKNAPGTHWLGGWRGSSAYLNAA